MYVNKFTYDMCMFNYNKIYVYSVFKFATLKRFRQWSMHHRLTNLDLWLWQIETTSRQQESKVTITIIKLRHYLDSPRQWNACHKARWIWCKDRNSPQDHESKLYTLLLTYGWINKKMKCFKMSLYIMFLVTNYQHTIIFGYIIILWMIEIWKI